MSGIIPKLFPATACSPCCDEHLNVYVLVYALFRALDSHRMIRSFSERLGSERRIVEFADQDHIFEEIERNISQSAEVCEDGILAQILLFFFDDTRQNTPIYCAVLFSTLWVFRRPDMDVREPALSGRVSYANALCTAQNSTYDGCMLRALQRCILCSEAEDRPSFFFSATFFTWTQ
jgi:hypothetical protein